MEKRRIIECISLTVSQQITTTPNVIRRCALILVSVGTMALKNLCSSEEAMKRNSPAHSGKEE